MLSIPLTVMVPVIGIYYFGLTADQITYTDEYIEYLYTPMAFGLIKERNYNKLPNIKIDFD
jgi:hypothetical protein